MDRTPPPRARSPEMLRISADWARAAITLFVLCSGSALWEPARVHAQPEHRAVLVVPNDADETVREITARLQGELAAAGFGVSLHRLTQPLAPRLAIESGATEREAIAVILVRSDDAGSAGVELWISDRVLGRTSNTRLAVPDLEAPPQARGPSADSERARRLAVEAVDILRARLAELLLSAKLADQRRAETAAPIPSVAPKAAPPATLSPRIGLSVGALVLWRPAQWSLSPMPSLAIELSFSRGNAPGSSSPTRERTWQAEWALSLRAAGYGRDVARESERGSLTAQQGLGVVAASLRAVSELRLSPELTLGGGAYGVDARGEALPPYRAHDTRHVVPLLFSALGLRVGLLRWLVLRLSADLMLALRESSLRIAGQQVARTGGTMLAARLELTALAW
jgi:hypothetical protein